MAYRENLKEAAKELGWLLNHRLHKADSRTVGEQFDRTKKISDFVGFLTRLMFLAAIQAFITEASKSASIPWQVIYSFVGAILLMVQFYFSYSISFIATKVALKTIPKWLDIDMNFQLGRNRQTVVFFMVLTFLQVVYFGVNSTLQEAVSRSAASVSSQKVAEDVDKTGTGEDEKSQNTSRHNGTN